MEMYFHNSARSYTAMTDIVHHVDSIYLYKLNLIKNFVKKQGPFYTYH